MLYTLKWCLLFFGITIVLGGCQLESKKAIIEDEQKLNTTKEPNQWIYRKTTLGVSNVLVEYQIPASFQMSNEDLGHTYKLIDDECSVLCELSVYDDYSEFFFGMDTEVFSVKVPDDVPELETLESSKYNLYQPLDTLKIAEFDENVLIGMAIFRENFSDSCENVFVKVLDSINITFSTSRR